jgi:glycerate 2-kinase
MEPWAVKVLVATGGFKEGLEPDAACELIARGLRLADPDVEIVSLPLADGGTGLVSLLVRREGSEIITHRVSGPLPSTTVNASYGRLQDDTYVIESASAAGLALIDEHDRDPRLTSTRGVGELIRHAYENGARKFVIGCGDSATNDVGIGCANALGVELLDSFGSPVPAVGQHLATIARLEQGELARAIAEECEIDVACNPNSILCGPSGTTRAYAPQKGADPDAVIELEQGVESFVGKLEAATGRELRYAPGGGGAGGLAGMLHALFGARLRFSFDIVRRYVDLDEHLANCDLVITGEGLLDRKTLLGKLPANVALYAKRFDKPVAVVAGGVSDRLSLVYLSGIDAIELSTPRPCELTEAIANVEEWLPAASERLMRKLQLGARLRAREAAA